MVMGKACLNTCDELPCRRQRSGMVVKQVGPVRRSKKETDDVLSTVFAFLFACFAVHVVIAFLKTGVCCMCFESFKDIYIDIHSPFSR